jgi:hypothetical protein
VKGTKLWQGTGSPLIEGRSRQVKPFWQPWLVAALLATATSTLVAWLWLHTLPLVVFAACSVVAAALGVWFGRKVGSRRSWLVGLLGALVANAAVYVALGYWMSSALNQIGAA